MATITAREAAHIIAAEQRQFNEAKLPPTLARIRVLQEEEYFHICNVGPWNHRIERGCVQFTVPGYDSKSDTESVGYAKGPRMPEIQQEAIQTMIENQYTWLQDDGRAMALDMIGVGHSLPVQNSLVQYGVFVPAGKLPNKSEIQEANRQLERYVDRLIEEARDAYDKGPEERKAVIGSDTEGRHIWAAHHRGIDEAWVHHKHTEEAVRCEMCGKRNPSEVAMCACGNIVNPEIYKRVLDKQRKIRKDLGLAEPAQKA